MGITGTKEWAEEKNNCIIGCCRNCRYCYAKKTNIRFKKCTKDTWKDELQNKNAKPRKHKGRIMFPTSHDLPFKNLYWWAYHLDGLLKLGNDILIVSKPEFKSIQYIVEKYKDTPYKNKIEFRFTIGTDDEKTREFWEPGAPPMEERIQCLKHAYENGFRTSVSMEPLLVEDPTQFIKRIDPYVTGEIWIGLMNYIHKSDFTQDETDWYNKQIKINSYENIIKVYHATKNNPKIKYKDSVRDLLGLGEQNGA
jgi:DNA repair photolyase